VLEEGIVDQTFEAKVHQMLYQDNNGLNLNNKVQNIAYRQPKMPLIYYEFNEDIRKQAEEAIKADDSEVLPEQLYNKYEHEASKCWDKFYRWHKSNFFKDR
jgi:methyltransferase-like protein 6